MSLPFTPTAQVPATTLISQPLISGYSRRYTSLYSLESIFHLEDVPVGTEDWSTAVSSYPHYTCRNVPESARSYPEAMVKDGSSTNAAECRGADSIQGRTAARA